jgi:hypothetical protein
VRAPAPGASALTAVEREPRVVELARAYYDLDGLVRDVLRALSGVRGS